MAITIAREELRESILDAANRLLARYGYRKMTMDDLAAEARIGKGTIYLCFPSKEEVALSTIDRLVERLLERMRELASQKGDPGERLRRLLVERVMYRFDHRSHDSQSIDELLSALRTSFLARRERYFEAEASVLAEVIEDGRAAGAFAVDDSRAAARSLVVATNALLPYSLSVRELGDREHVASQVERVARLLLFGLSRAADGSRGTPHPHPGDGRT